MPRAHHFVGQVDLQRPLTLDESIYLTLFNVTPRMVRSEDVIANWWRNATAKISKQTVPFPKSLNGFTNPQNRLPRIALLKNLGLPIGQDGDFWIADVDSRSGRIISDDPSVVRAHEAPKSQPSRHCPWKPTSNGTSLVIAFPNEQIESHLEWLRYICQEFLGRWGNRLVGGSMTWDEVNPRTKGKMVVDGDKIVVLRQKPSQSAVNRWRNGLDFSQN